MRLFYTTGRYITVSVTPLSGLPNRGNRGNWGRIFIGWWGRGMASWDGLQRIPKTLSCVRHFLKKKKIGWHPANSAEVQHSHWICILSVLHIPAGFSNFERICSGPVRPHLQRSAACASVHDRHRRPPALQLLRLSVALHLHP
jgi:hypothetical protein